VSWVVFAIFIVLGLGFLALSVPMLGSGRFPGWMVRRPVLMWPLKKTAPRIARLQSWAGLGAAALMLGVALLAVLPFNQATAVMAAVAFWAVAILALVVWAWSAVLSRR
jgi:hypothetical protein